MNNPQLNSTEKKTNESINQSQYKVVFEDNKEDDLCNLLISIKLKEIYFKIIHINNFSLNYYEKRYELKEIVNILNLPPSLYDTLEKVKKIIDDFFSKKIYKFKKEENKIILIFKIPILFEEIESKIELNKINLESDDFIYEEMINLKNKVNSNEEEISKLKEKNKELENKLDILEKKIIEIENLNKLLIMEKTKGIKEMNDKRENNIKEKLNHKFIKDPTKLKYKMDINSTNDFFGRNDIFEVFISYKDFKEYLISKNKNNYNLDIYRLEDNALIKSIKHHSNHITIVRYFLDNKSNNEYLLTADENKMVTLWDITNDYKLLYDIKPGYSGKIYSSLLVFGINEKNYLFTSSTGTSEYTKKYNLETGKFIENINKTNSNYTYYLIYWFNNKNNENYIIECCENKTSIHNLLKDEIYAELKAPNEGRHMSGFIYNKNDIDYLCNGCGNGYIHIWNLFNKSLDSSIYVNGSYYLHHIIRWNDKYAIIADVTNYSFKIIDYEEKKYICNIGGQHSNYVIGVKKIYHPIYGESLLSTGWDYTIKLWCNTLIE